MVMVTKILSLPRARQRALSRLQKQAVKRAFALEPGVMHVFDFGHYIPAHNFRSVRSVIWITRAHTVNRIECISDDGEHTIDINRSDNGRP